MAFNQIPLNTHGPSKADGDCAVVVIVRHKFFIRTSTVQRPVKGY